MRTLRLFPTLATLPSILGFLLGAGPAGAAAVVYDFQTPAAQSLAGSVSATYAAGGRPLRITAGTLDQDGRFVPGDADATLAVVLESDPFEPGSGLGVLSSIRSGSFPEEGLSRVEGLLFQLAAGFAPARIRFSGLTLGGPEGGGAFEAVRIFADGAFLADVQGSANGEVTVPLPPGISSLSVTPLLHETPEIPSLSSDPVFFVAAIEGTALLEVAFDLKPGSCPNPINTKSRGVLPAAILGTAALNPLAIDPATVRLAGVPPLRTGLEDVAAPAKGGAGRCTAAGPDGRPDLTLKFDTQAVVRALEAALGPLRNGQVVVLPLEGRLYDGTRFVGEDLAVIHTPGRTNGH